MADSVGISFGIHFKHLTVSERGANSRFQRDVYVAATLVLACSYGEAMPRTPGMWRGARAGSLPGAFKHHHETVTKGALVTTTYVSPPLPLAAGQVIFTDPQVRIADARCCQYSGARMRYTCN